MQTDYIPLLLRFPCGDLQAAYALAGSIKEMPLEIMFYGAPKGEQYEYTGRGFTLLTQGMGTAR